MIVFGPLGTGLSVALVVATKVASICQVQSSSLCVKKQNSLALLCSGTAGCVQSPSASQLRHRAFVGVCVCGV